MLGGRTVAFAADSRGIVRMSPTPADWMKIAEYGFGALALVWIGIYVVVPLRDRHTKFLDKVEETNDRLTNAIDKQADILLNLQTGSGYDIFMVSKLGSAELEVYRQEFAEDDEFFGEGCVRVD